MIDNSRNKNNSNKNEEVKEIVEGLLRMDKPDKYQASTATKNNTTNKENEKARVQQILEKQKPKQQINYVFADPVGSSRKKCGCFKPEAFLNSNAEGQNLYKMKGNNNNVDDPDTHHYLIGSSSTSIIKLNRVESALPNNKTNKKQLSCKNKKKCTCGKDTFLMDETATCKCNLSIASIPVKQNSCPPPDNCSLESKLLIPEAIATPLERNIRTQTSMVFKSEPIDHALCIEKLNCYLNDCGKSEEGSKSNCETEQPNEDDYLSPVPSKEYILFWQKTEPFAKEETQCCFPKKIKKHKRRRVAKPLPYTETECQFLYRQKLEQNRKTKLPPKPKPTMIDSLKHWCPAAFKLDPDIVRSQLRKLEKIKKKLSKQKNISVCPYDALFFLKNLNNPIIKIDACGKKCLPLVECAELSKSDSNRMNLYESKTKTINSPTAFSDVYK